MRAMRAAFVAVAIAAFAVTLGSGPTFASPSVPAADPIQTFQNQNTGRCIDDTNSGGFRTFPCNGTAAQQWRVHVFADSTRRLQNVNTGRCMRDGSNGFFTQTCDLSTNNSWFIDHPAAGQIAFRNQNTGRCIDDTNSGGFRTFPCNGTPAQQWH